MLKRLVVTSAAVALLVTFAISRSAVQGITPASSVDSSIFGVNMSLFDGNEQMITDAATRAIFVGWHTPVIRMPFRSTLSDAVELQALTAISSMGATPLVIVHGATDANVLADDTHLLSLASQVFGSSLVYVEYGNEEDLAGVNATTYTNSWNATVPTLKALHPTYQFIGPVNFQYNPTYVGYFVGHAQPLPDIVSWHEYVCNTSETTAYCMSHIANWATHVSLTNAAEVTAIGHTVPFMFTEWNMDPQNDPRYLDPTVMGPWTAAALQELQQLVPQGLVGAQLYTADSHGGGFELVDSSNALTPEGTAFAGALGSPPPAPTTTTTTGAPTTSTTAAPQVGPTTTVVNPGPTTTIAGPGPTTTVTGAPAGGPAGGAGGGPNGPTDPVDKDAGLWQKAWGSVTLANGVAPTGGAAMTITTQGGYASVSMELLGFNGPATITYHVYSPVAGVHVMPFATDGRWHNWFVPTLTLAQGWNTVRWSVPTAIGNVRDIGLQVNLWSGTLSMDKVTW
jgi:hypothetical protein